MTRFSDANRRSGAGAASLALAVCLTLPLTFTAVGCGGGSGSVRSPGSLPAAQARGRATFAVRWPEREGRLVPVLANSIVITVRSADGQVVGSATLNRPESSGAALANSAVIDPLPTGELMVSAAAYPEPGGAGVAQASAVAPLTIRANGNTEIRMALQSTIDRLEVTTAGSTVGVASTTQIAATARDADGSVVLISPGKLRFELLSDPKFARLDTAAGILTGSAVGEAQVRVTEDESGKSAIIAMKITRSAAYRLIWFPSLPNLPYIYPTAVNAKGEVVGYCNNRSFDTPTGFVVSTGFYWQPSIDGSGGKMTEIKPPDGDVTIRILSINDRGQAVGVTQDAGLHTRAFVWENGKTTILPAPVPGLGCSASDINASGDIVGTTDVPLSNGMSATRPCIWRNGIPAVVDLPSTVNQQNFSQGTVLDVSAINDSGAFVGRFYEKDIIYTNLWSPNSTLTRLLAPVNQQSADVRDINNSGQIVGSYTTTAAGRSVRHGYVLQNGRLTDIAPPPGSGHTSLFAYGIAGDGTTTGWSAGPGGEVKAFRWRYGVTEDLNKLLPANTPGPFTLTRGTAASGNGYLTGVGLNGDTEQGFLLTPQGGTGGANVGVN